MPNKLTLCENITAFYSTIVFMQISDCRQTFKSLPGPYWICHYQFIRYFLRKYSHRPIKIETFKTAQILMQN